MNDLNKVDCWQCGGLGVLAGCCEDCCSGADCDPEDALMCCSPVGCDLCRGKGAYEVPDSPTTTQSEAGK